MLRNHAVEQYLIHGKSCAEAILIAASKQYNLGISQQDAELFAGFRTGMGCGSTCGALIGAIGVLSRLYSGKPDFKNICAGFVTEFTDKLNCESTDCSILEAKYKTAERRCAAALELAADVLEAFIEKTEHSTLLPADSQQLTPEDIKRVKGLGFLQHKGTTRFNARVITRNGRITDSECAAIAEAARKYGDGHLMMTSRLTIEVSGIEYKNINAFRDELTEAGLETGGTGSKVRPVVSCKGTTCQYGLYDTYRLSEDIHNLFYKGYHNVSLPHKFKIAVGGCPNNCVKPNLNDLGIIGARMPIFDISKCKGCKICQVETSCPIHIARMIDGKIHVDPDQCNNCGRCIGKCPFHCNDESVSGWRIYIGGRWGKKVTHGRMINKHFTDYQEVLDTVEKSILLFRAEGIPGERFADTIDRIGFEQAQKMILSNTLLENKSTILGITVTGGATC